MYVFSTKTEGRYIHIYVNSCIYTHFVKHVYTICYLTQHAGCLGHGNLAWASSQGHNMPTCMLLRSWQPRMGTQPRSQYAHMHAALAMATQCGHVANAMACSRVHCLGHLTILGKFWYHFLYKMFIKIFSKSIPLKKSLTFLIYHIHMIKF